MDKHRHAIHLEAHQQLLKKDKPDEKKEKAIEEPESVSLWKQYRSTTDHRKDRKTIGRGRSRDEDMEGVVVNSVKSKSEVVDAMDVDETAETGKNAAGAVVEPDEPKNEPEAEVNPSEGLQKLPSADLLSDRELHLCRLSNLKPAEYLEIKRMIVQQSTAAGLVEQRRKTLLLIDVERRGDVIDFLVKAGWVSPKVEAEVRSINL